MARRRIEIEKGGIKPLKRGRWFSAFEKLHEADHAIAVMRSAVDRIEYEGGWTQFVDSIEELWARLFDEGKNISSKFQPWAGKFDATRKADPLLQYITQARHQSQHGRISLEWEQPKLLIAPGFNGHIRGLQILPDGTFEMDATPLHESLPDADIVNSPGKPLLPIIENKKFNQKYLPPKEHEGNLIADQTPIGIAEITLKYYSNVLSLANKKFPQNTDGGNNT